MDWMGRMGSIMLHGQLSLSGSRLLPSPGTYIITFVSKLCRAALSKAHRSVGWNSVRLLFVSMKNMLFSWEPITWSKFEAIKDVTVLAWVLVWYLSWNSFQTWYMLCVHRLMVLESIIYGEYLLNIARIECQSILISPKFSFSLCIFWMQLLTTLSKKYILKQMQENARVAKMISLLLAILLKSGIVICFSFHHKVVYCDYMGNSSCPVGSQSCGTTWGPVGTWYSDLLPNASLLTLTFSSGQRSVS